MFWLFRPTEVHLTVTPIINIDNAVPRYVKRGEFYYHIEQTDCGPIIGDEKVFTIPQNAEVIAE